MKRAKAKKKRSPPQAGGKCFNCHRVCSREDWCFGCQALVCEYCVEPSVLANVFADGEHEPDDHLYRVIRVPRGWENKRGSGIRVITDDDEE